MPCPNLLNRGLDVGLTPAANGRIRARPDLGLWFFVADFDQAKLPTDRAELSFAFVETAVDLLGRRHRIADHVGQGQVGARHRLAGALEPPPSWRYLDQLHGGGTTNLTGSPTCGGVTTVTGIP